MSTFIFFIYKFVLAPVAYGLFQICYPLLTGKLREMTDDKNKKFYLLKNSGTESDIIAGRPFWIHAASGEIEYARPVIRELKKLYPQIPILVTYSSPSAKKILRGLSEVDVWAALPWDLDSCVEKFILFWQPRVLLFSRTDVWPVLTSVAKRKNLPMTLFSATFAKNSSRLRGISRYLTQHSLQHLSEIHCVSQEDIMNLKSLNLATPVIVSGDTRFDQVFHRLENPQALRNELIPSPEDFVFIAGSTWPEDEAIIIPAITKLQNVFMRFIIAPHETTPVHLEILEKQIAAAGLKSVRYSRTLTWPPNAILLIDQVGVLAEFYTWGDLAFVGGSFKKQVHSVMEPLAAGLPVMVGPHHQNNREALSYQKKTFSCGIIVQVIYSSEDMIVLLQRMKKMQNKSPYIKEEIRTEIGKNKNSTLRILRSLEKII